MKIGPEGVGKPADAKKVKPVERMNMTSGEGDVGDTHQHLGIPIQIIKCRRPEKLAGTRAGTLRVGTGMLAKSVFQGHTPA